MPHRLCLINCYFGSWPSYINLFLESCTRNPSVDFLLVTDCPIPAGAPENVSFVSMSFADVRHLVCRHLSSRAVLDRPYKLCDYKPTFGVLFEEHLSGYDFWGCTDIDLIYGNIRRFVPETLLNETDVVAARPWYLTGFFFLMRNTTRINRLYEHSRDWPRVIENSDHFSFCECSFAWQQLRREGRSIFEADTEIESMTEVLRRAERTDDIRLHFAEMARESVGTTPILYDRGRVYEGAKEWLLLHFVASKSQYSFAFPNWRDVPERYHVTHTGLYRPGEMHGLRHLQAMRTVKISKQWLRSARRSLAGRWKKAQRRLGL